MKDRAYLLRAKIAKNLRAMSPARIIVLVFMLLVLVGAGLLCLPVASANGEPTPFLSALFTATSCVCVTGLSVVETGLHWSTFGHVVMLGLIQIGGLGFMTILSIFYIAMRKRVSMRQRMLLTQALSFDALGGVVGMVKRIVKGTLLFEGIGAIVLTLCFLPRFGFARALWYGIFHAVSAFCNAGFDLLADVGFGGSFSYYRTDVLVNLTLIFLIVVGGLGFFVWSDIRQNRRFSRLSVYTRLVLVITAILLLGGTALIAVLEWNNLETLGALSAPQKILAAAFQSVTLRTAGFFTIEQGALKDTTLAVCDLLMFIGGSSGSTAGGLKTVTMGILVLCALCMLRGRSRVTVMRRTIPQKKVLEALSLFFMMLMLVFAGAVFIAATNGWSLSSAMFESVSALATVGLTANGTATLNAASKLILILFMFFGRVGIMTIGVGFMTGSTSDERWEYAQAKVMIG